MIGVGYRSARPHDLLRIDPRLARAWSAPAWVLESLERAPWVVVRRAISTPAAIAIGVRGRARGERYAACVRSDDVLALRTPHELVAHIGYSGGAVERTARGLDDAARASHVRWGPTGAYGFELASGVVVTHAASDLDGLVETEASTTHEARAVLGTFAAACRRITVATGVRIDLELQLRNDGVALDEYLGRADPMLAKTNTGPALVAR